MSVDVVCLLMWYVVFRIYVEHVGNLTKLSCEMYGRCYCVKYLIRKNSPRNDSAQSGLSFQPSALLRASDTEYFPSSLYPHPKSSFHLFSPRQQQR